MKKGKKKKNGPTTHNRSVYATPPVGGLASVHLGRLRLPRLTSAHFCNCWNALHSFIAIAKTSYTAGTLGAILAWSLIKTEIRNRNFWILIISCYVRSEHSPSLKQHLTGLYTLRRWSGSAPSCACSTTFLFCATALRPTLVYGVNLVYSPNKGHMGFASVRLTPRRIQPLRYVQVCLTWFFNIDIKIIL